MEGSLWSRAASQWPCLEFLPWVGVGVIYLLKVFMESHPPVG